MPQVDRAITHAETTGSSAEFDALLDAAVDAIVLIDRAGHIKNFSRAAEKMFGYAATEVIGENVSLLMPEPHRRDHDSYLSNYLATGQARIIGIGREVTGVRKDGSQFPVELSVGEISRAGSEGFVGIMRDLSQRHEMERKLAERQEALRMILENAPLGMVLADMDGRFLAVNPRCTSMLGYSDSELLDLGIAEVTHPDDLASARHYASRALEGNLDNYSITKRCITKDGREVPVTMHVAIVHDEKGNPLHQVIQVEDLRSEIDAENQLRELRDRLTHVGRLTTMGEMAASIAHEINQPLTAIASYSEATQRLLNADSTDTTQVRSILGKIADQAHRASDVIARVRQLVRKGSGERRVININEVIREVVKLAEIDARGFGTPIRLRFTDSLPTVVADPVQIQQVLLNLFRNALESAHIVNSSSRPIEVRTFCDDRAVRVSISDRGTGFTEEYLRNLFEPFVSTKPGGMGMGLAISRSIVEAHGGRLRARNNADGGATLTFSLPISDEA